MFSSLKMVVLYNNAGQKETLVWAQEPTFFLLSKKLKRMHIASACTVY